jgi:hypothetical protein
MQQFVVDVTATIHEAVLGDGAVAARMGQKAET